MVYVASMARIYSFRNKVKGWEKVIVDDKHSFRLSMRRMLAKIQNASNAFLTVRPVTTQSCTHCNKVAIIMFFVFMLYEHRNQVFLSLTTEIFLDTYAENMASFPYI